MGIAEHLQRGIAAHQAGDLDTAAEAYAAVLALEPRHPDGLHFSGLLKSRQGAGEEGAALIRDSLAVHPDNPGAHNNLGSVLKGLGRIEEAEAAYRAALQLDPDHADSLNNLGLLLRGRGALGEAVDLLRRAVAVQPRRGEAWHNLGMAEMLSGNAEAAADAFETCIGIGAKATLDPVWHARALCALGREARAIEHLEAHLAAHPDDPVAVHQMAAIRGQAGPRAPDDYVRSHFDSFAKSFDEILKNLNYKAPEAVGRVVAGRCEGHPPLAEIVDLGCGTGLCGPFLRGYCDTLTGVDLSPGMLAQADAAGGYDALIEAELVAYLEGRAPGSIPLAVSADTLIYFGALEGVMAALVRALSPGGVLIATLEHLTGAEGYRVDKSGRYAHSRDYLERTISASGLRLTACEQLVLRTELGVPVEGLVFTAQRPDAWPPGAPVKIIAASS